jgi:hypothetical protein
MVSAWITAAEATAILSSNSGHEVNESHIRRLARDGKVETKQVDQRTKLYRRSQVEKIRIRQKGTTHESTK